MLPFPLPLAVLDELPPSSFAFLAVPLPLPRPLPLSTAALVDLPLPLLDKPPLDIAVVSLAPVAGIESLAAATKELSSGSGTSLLGSG